MGTVLKDDPKQLRCTYLHSGEETCLFTSPVVPLNSLLKLKLKLKLVRSEPVHS